MWRKSSRIAGSYILRLDSYSGPVLIEVIKRIVQKRREVSDITYLAAMINGTFEIEHMKRTLDIFKAWPDYEQRVRTVFTRVEPCDANEQNKLAEAMGYPVSTIIPNEYMLVSSAANNGQMAILEQPDSRFAQMVNQMADSIIGSKAHVRLG